MVIRRERDDYVRGDYFLILTLYLFMIFTSSYFYTFSKVDEIYTSTTIIYVYFTWDDTSNLLIQLLRKYKLKTNIVTALNTWSVMTD